MHMSLRRAVPAALALACAGLASAPSVEAARSPMVHTVVIDKMKFGPPPAGIRVGDTILWINRDIFRHTATARDKSFEVDLAAKASGRTVVTRAGPVPFYCKYHPSMKGALTVAR